MLIPFATQSAPQDYAGGRLFNYSYQPTQGPSQGAMLGRSGLQTFATLTGNPAKPVREMTQMKGDLYAAAGGELWKITTAGTATKVGTVADDIDTQMDASADLALITAGGRYSTCDGASTTGRSTGQIIRARGVAHADQYAVIVGEDATRGDRIAVSNISDPTTFSGLDFATAEADPDGSVGVIRDHSELRVFGDRTAEAFYNSGAVFPFTRQAGAIMERGCLRASTIAKADNAIYWIGDDRKAYRAFGAGPEIISTGEISELFQTADILGGFTFEDRGRKYYAVRIEGGPTWCYCIATGLWSEFTTGAAHGPWIATAAEQIGGVWYIGTSNGTICTFGGWQDEGEPVRAEMYAMPIVDRWVQANLIEVQMDTGKGSLGRERELNMRTSRDGKIWSASKPRDLGDLGEYRRMARWNGNGRFRDFFQANFWITDPVQRDIYGGRLG